MSYKHDIIKERFDLDITDQGEIHKATWELDHHADILYGLTVTSDNEESLFYRGSQKIQVNDSELFPEDFESKLLMAGLNVSPNMRVVRVGRVETGNNKIEIWFKDSDHPQVRFSPYRVSFYFFSKTKNGI